MEQNTQNTAQNTSQTVGAGAAQTDQTSGQAPGEYGDEPGLRGHDEQAGQGIGGEQYDDDGVLAQQTPGLDAEQIRRDAGPDWPAGTSGDIELDTSPSGGSGAASSDGGSSSGTSS